MTSPEAETWEPATAEDLVADALALGVPKASPRMITDWTEHGLLGSPAFQKSTRHGSDARLYSPDQRRLFTEMLKARLRSPLARVPHHTLIRPVLHMWLIDDVVIPDSQARRAWRTWARSAGKNTAAKRSEIARKLVDQVAHPAAPYHQRRKAQLLIEQGEKARSPEWGKLYSALTEVCSPWPSPAGQRIERAVEGPDFPVGIREVVSNMMLRQKVTRRLGNEEVSEPLLVEARAEHRRGRQWYEASRSYFQERAVNPETFAEPSDLEAQVIEQVDAFIQPLGHQLGLVQEVLAEARAFGSRTR
ncbi:hypothetical protein ACFYXH_26760 [Streptomyces sp. NPDC002730]|uniref:hypothetical protein n=1 Tax=Streptomyces sp. NPDC002730 TaxID=3364662 RepID=UPI00369CB719